MVIALKPVEGSSQVEAFGYDMASRTLAVKFHRSATYHVKDVPSHLVEQFEKAPSLGKFFNAQFRGQFEIEKQPGDAVEPKADVTGSAEAWQLPA